MTSQLDTKNEETPIDPLRRIFVPIEKRMTNGNRVFYTLDKERYIRDEKGVIRRANPKVNGKEAKKARQRCRQLTQR